jgi:hypothetical protein
MPPHASLPATPIPAAPTDCNMDTAPMPTPDVAAVDIAHAAQLPAKEQSKMTAVGLIVIPLLYVNPHSKLMIRGNCVFVARQTQSLFETIPAAMPPEVKPTADTAAGTTTGAATTAVPTAATLAIVPDPCNKLNIACFGHVLQWRPACIQP